MFMYPREEPGQWGEATLNIFEMRIKWLSELSEIPPALATGRGIHKRFGIKLQHYLQERELSLQKELLFHFYSDSILIRLGLHAHLRAGM